MGSGVGTLLRPSAPLCLELRRVWSCPAHMGCVLMHLPGKRLVHTAALARTCGQMLSVCLCLVRSHAGAELCMGNMQTMFAWVSAPYCSKGQSAVPLSFWRVPGGCQAPPRLSL